MFLRCCAARLGTRPAQLGHPFMHESAWHWWPYAQLPPSLAALDAQAPTAGLCQGSCTMIPLETNENLCRPMRLALSMPGTLREGASQEH
jgi:hypothetical protein